MLLIGAGREEVARCERGEGGKTNVLPTCCYCVASVFIPFYTILYHFAILNSPEGGKTKEKDC